MGRSRCWLIRRETWGQTSEAEWSDAEGQTFSAVRRQREQALTRTIRPSRLTIIGCRFGIHRRNARLRFIPTDCGFQPVIGFFPQMSHTRAIRAELHS